jgi:AcrR family transcriptional regulator
VEVGPSGEETGEASGEPTEDTEAGCGAHLVKRADARRNRVQILKAAEESFAEFGVGVPIDVIAQRACVGVGTVYRHFPTKEALAEAVIASRMQQLAEDANALATSDNPGEAFYSFVQRLAEEGTAKRDLVDALSGAGIEVKAKLSAEKEAMDQAMGALLERAQAVGAVRQDVELADLFGLIMGTCALAGSVDVGCSRTRMLSVVCDGLRGSTSKALTEDDQLSRASSPR